MNKHPRAFDMAKKRKSEENSNLMTKREYLQQRQQSRPAQAPNYQNDPRQYYQPRPQQAPQQAPQQQMPRQQMPYGQYQQPQAQPQPKRVDKPDEFDMRKFSSGSKGSTEVAANMGPKVSKEQVMQIDMVFKICIMVWAAAALVTTIVLLTR